MPLSTFLGLLGKRLHRNMADPADCRADERYEACHPGSFNASALNGTVIFRLAPHLVRFDRWCGRDRGGMAVLCAVMIPALIGLGALTIDQGYYGYRSLLLKQTTQNAALAAAEQLYTYYTTGKNTTVVSTAQTYAGLNMPSAKYGMVVTTSNVVLGTWSGTAFTAGGTNPTAVQVTGLNTTANSNAVPLFLGSFFGKSSVDISSTAVASYGSGKAFNTIVINDMSESFSGELSDQVSADQQILNCVKGVVGATSYFGVTLINGHAYTYIPLTLAQTNYTTLNTKVTALTSCDSSGDPNCSTGSNIGSGIYSAIQQLSSSTYTGTSKNIVIITDGVPNASSGVNYTTADGVSCGKKCSDADLQAGTQAQATAAKAAGINVSTIYYSGDTSPSDQSTYEKFLAGLVSGTGTALVAPSTAAIDAAYGALCSSIPSVLKLAN
jgi:Flp pilus assembly protein TadG